MDSGVASPLRRRRSRRRRRRRSRGAAWCGGSPREVNRRSPGRTDTWLTWRYMTARAQSTEKETEDDACVYLGEYISKEWACGGLGLGEGDVEGARDVGGEGVDALGCERFDVNANAVLCA